jgi:hypothetical protein
MKLEVTMLTVDETLAVADQLLPGRPAPKGIDARWQAIIQVATFAEREPEAIWPFVLKWGRTKTMTSERPSLPVYSNTFCNIISTCFSRGSRPPQGQMSSSQKQPQCVGNLVKRLSQHERLDSMPSGRKFVIPPHKKLRLALVR